MIVGIDPSLTNTAVCSGKEGHWLRTFQSKACPGDVRSRLARFEQLVAQIADHLETLRPIDGIFLEGYSVGSHTSGVIDRVEYGGLLRWHLLDLAPVIVELAPLSLKKFVAGTARAPKGEGKTLVIASLARRYGVSFATNDEYDALGLWWFGRCYLGIEEPSTNAQREVLSKLHQGHQKKPRKKKQPAAPTDRAEPLLPF